MPELDERFPEFDAAFATLRATAPTATPGADAVRRTVRRRRTRRRTVRLAAVLVVVVLVGIDWVSRLQDSSETVRIAPATGGPSTAVSSPAVGGALLDLDTVPLEGGAALNVPERPGGCPAATLHLSAATRSDTVGGVEYTVYGQSVLASGDLTGDGHAERVILIGCGDQGVTRHVLVVVGSTGPTTYATIAAEPFDLDVGDPGLRVQSRRIVVYDSHYAFDSGNRVGTYVLDGNGTLTRGS